MFFSKFSPTGSKVKEELGLTLFEELAKLDLLYDPFPWKAGHWQQLSKSEDEALFLLAQQEIIGWAVFKLIPSDSLAHLLKFLILPDFRKKGHGQILLKNALSELQSLNYLKFYLEVERNNNAISLYQKAGFRAIHEIPHFYGQGRNAIAMTR